MHHCSWRTALCSLVLVLLITAPIIFYKWYETETRHEPTRLKTTRKSPMSTLTRLPNASQQAVSTTSRPTPACGKSTFQTLRQRIHLGQGAQAGDWPWAVYIPGVPCSGSVLAERWILTAAHCTTNRPLNELAVHAGFLTPGENARLISVQRVVRFNATYSPISGGNNVNHDIALLQLTQSLVYSEHVVPVCLPEPSMDLTVVPDLTCYLQGYGRGGSGEQRNYLQYARVALNTSCDHGCALCGYHPPNDAGPCVGDSGGPVVCLMRGAWVQFGSVSSGRWERGGQECRDKTVDVYMSIVCYVKWINDTINIQ